MVLAQLASSPHWFYGIDAIFELFSLIVATTIAFYGYKIYKISGEVKYSHFSFSFLFLALALMVRGILDISIFEFIKNQGIRDFLSTIALGNSPLHNSGTDLYRLLMLSGYAFLIKALYKIEDWQKSSLLSLAVFVGVLGGKFTYFFIFNIVAFLLLLVIVKFFYDNYLKKKSINAKLTLLAFGLLALSELFFVLLLANSGFYTAAHLTRLSGFAVLAYNLYLVFRK